MTECDLYPLFSHYIRDNWKRGSAVFELKICKKNRIPLNALEVHQLRALKMTSSGTGIYYKLSDQSMGQKPWDSFFLSEVPAYVVVCFYKVGDYPVYFIPVDKWVSDDKSFTEDECMKIAAVVANLKGQTKKAIRIKP